MTVTQPPQETEAIPQPTVESLSTKVLQVIRQNIALLERSVSAKDVQPITRVLRGLASVRKHLTVPILQEITTQHLHADTPRIDKLLQSLSQLKDTEMKATESPAAMEVDEPEKKEEKKYKKSMLPEVEVYIFLLSIQFLVDQHHAKEALELCKDLINDVINQQNRRTLDVLTARVYFYLSWTTELTGNFAELRPQLLAAHRTAAVRNDPEGQATLLNLLLRNYLHFNLYDQADKLVSKSVFPEGVSNNQMARYLYYVGRIKSLQLDYSEAYKVLLQAFRKAPQLGTSALGFRIATQRLMIIVQLLMGEIPERAVFRTTGMRDALAPYLELTQAVRRGNLNMFKEVAQQHRDQFLKDKTFNLITRLRHNVIKAGLRHINLAYSKIALVDIAKKLALESVDMAETIVAKAIRDGVIEGTIDLDQGCLISQESYDIYATDEPQKAYHKRITFCLNMHNEAVMSMKFPDKEHRHASTGETPMNEEELAEALADEVDDLL
eukprot:TRINITY_DN18673_c0_g1::TRINITY_DN18673_c0_g1_i1::g.20512::m.20512 TRINITY_DN18673_c0_g1::TRINITY_DN18673_c0_g1_i1::g.20512  ORF type:complete len:509 (+),score=114.12,sp/O61470/PSMD3_ANOGA/46.72/2e-132,PCI/PF01399.22/6.7e-19,Rpn3_C/PF08375.6/5.5e+03,Rpn3_C/PF08375.6/1.9e-18,TPR_12/PF13424.1/2.8e+02,TPR_12/PF13424.1/0.0036,PCI_Csn8/PF10075.4/0.14,Apc3/PF12895.2/47,Apc3/PF12895.2/7.7 TRINITY_DN18673_c0_g1_i1:40-1527(+)